MVDELRLTLRNVSYPAVEPGDRDTSAHWRRRERVVRLPVGEGALLRIDVWDTENDRHANPPVGERIVRDRTAPLLSAARTAGMLLIHAPHRP